MIRIGSGYDVHKLEKGHKLILGGIEIPSEKGSVGHSDADVLLHAIADALLGSLALGDIGTHFPDTNPEYKGADSKKLLEEVVRMISSKGYKIVNLDSTVCLQKPKIKNYIPRMQEIISEILLLPKEMVSMKATTTEKLGFVGEGKGIASFATVLVEKIQNPHQ